jgi:phosphoribosylaminoimidazolecarboxamide formyltransferase / IMP cyclohydrolase
MSNKRSSIYFTASGKVFPDKIQILGGEYEKVEDLRYGTNPNQGAAFYRPAGAESLVLGSMEILKSGKGGLSQTNLEDMHHALSIVKYFAKPACAVMKHLNPSGAALQFRDEPQVEVYRKAREADSRAAFGSVVAFNTRVDEATAAEIMGTVAEGVVAPDYEKEALAAFGDFERFGRNRHIRVVRVTNLDSLPRFEGDDTRGVLEVKVFGDGSLVVAEPFLTSIRGPEDLKPAEAETGGGEKVVARTRPTPDQVQDLLFSWYVNFNVRSNGVIIARDGVTLAVGTGQQDRVGAVEQALAKARAYAGDEALRGASISSDGFFPFRDSIDLLARAGIAAVIQPGGSLRDFEVVEAANEHGIAMVFTGERCFSHH